MNTKFYTGVPDATPPRTVYMTQTLVRRGGSTCFVNEERDLCRQIVDPWGRIRNFPGVEVHPDLARQCAAARWEPVVRCSMAFGEGENGLIPVLWTIREAYFDPGDDWGFGREDIPGVTLRSFLDENGDFTQPFRLYAIGDTRWEP